MNFYISTFNEIKLLFFYPYFFAFLISIIFDRGKLSEVIILGSCYSKRTGLEKRDYTEQDAKTKAKVLELLYKRKMNHYYCEKCSSWHIGHLR